MIRPLAVAFDLDGTLIDTTEAHGQAYHLAFAEFGFEVEPSKFRPLMGRHHHDVIRALADPLAASVDVELLHGRKTSLYESVAPRFIRPLPSLGLVRLLAGNVPLAMVTSATKRTAWISMRGFVEFTDFDVVVTADDVVHHKPHPAPYLRTAELLRIEPCELLVIEDSESGLESARSAGCMTIQVDGAQIND